MRTMGKKVLPRCEPCAVTVTAVVSNSVLGGHGSRIMSAEQVWLVRWFCGNKSGPPSFYVPFPAPTHRQRAKTSHGKEVVTPRSVPEERDPNKVTVEGESPHPQQCSTFNKVSSALNAP